MHRSFFPRRILRSQVSIPSKQLRILSMQKAKAKSSQRSAALLLFASHSVGHECVGHSVRSYTVDSIDSLVHARPPYALSLLRFFLEWYESISGWKEYSLSGEAEQDDSVFVPGTCSSSLMEIFMQLCQLLDDTNSVSTNSEFIQKCREEALSRAYSNIAETYQAEITELLASHGTIASPGLLLVRSKKYFYS